MNNVMMSIFSIFITGLFGMFLKEFIKRSKKGDLSPKEFLLLAGRMIANYLFYASGLVLWSIPLWRGGENQKIATIISGNWIFYIVGTSILFWNIFMFGIYIKTNNELKRFHRIKIISFKFNKGDWDLFWIKMFTKFLGFLLIIGVPGIWLILQLENMQNSPLHLLVWSMYVVIAFGIAYFVAHAIKINSILKMNPLINQEEMNSIIAERRIFDLWKPLHIGFEKSVENKNWDWIYIPFDLFEKRVFTEIFGGMKEYVFVGEVNNPNEWGFVFDMTNAEIRRLIHLLKKDIKIEKRIDVIGEDSFRISALNIGDEFKILTNDFNNNAFMQIDHKKFCDYLSLWAIKNQKENIFKEGVVYNGRIWVNHSYKKIKIFLKDNKMVFVGVNIMILPNEIKSMFDFKNAEIESGGSFEPISNFFKALNLKCIIANEVDFIHSLKIRRKYRKKMEGFNLKELSFIIMDQNLDCDKRLNNYIKMLLHK
ncbi:hypothetical protein [Mycoplasma todarodis]|uniref:RDD domain-containing protein n=1 Tax=Mycoplasma todarodis TaxID=1937191 RepID=A0A4R0XT71_9MOLU|nr:hypothetical protein [Mycoplasma todarodis]TCG12093.1 hypothetical protein C4B25_00160 [Mycoplasma todarodis]